MVRPNDASTEGIRNFPFMTTHSWGEEPHGKWKLQLADRSPTSSHNKITLKSWALTLHGSNEMPVYPSKYTSGLKEDGSHLQGKEGGKKGDSAHQPSENELKHKMTEEQEESDSVLIDHVSRMVGWNRRSSRNNDIPDLTDNEIERLRDILNLPSTRKREMKEKKVMKPDNRNYMKKSYDGIAERHQTPNKVSNQINELIRAIEGYLDDE